MKQKYHEFLYFIYTVGFDVLGGGFKSLFLPPKGKKKTLFFFFFGRLGREVGPKRGQEGGALCRGNWLKFYVLWKSGEGGRKQIWHPRFLFGIDWGVTRRVVSTRFLLLKKKILSSRTWCNLVFTLTLPLLLYLAAVGDSDFWVNSLLALSQADLHLLTRFFSPILAPFPLLLPISVACKNLSSGFVALSLASNSASHLRSAGACHLTPFVYSSLTIFLLSFLHLRHLVYKCWTGCSASPHHQYSGLFITPILAKNIPNAPCPTLSW